MSKLIKVLAWAGGILLLAILILAIAFSLLFDPNDFKQQITQYIKDKTGRELIIQGAIKTTLFPWLGVDLGEVQLSNAPGFGAQPFATVKSARVRAQLLPLLLRKELRTDTIALQGVTLNLGKDASGKANWADLIAEDKQDRGLNLAALAIGGVDISDSTVVWDNRAGGTNYTLSNMSLRSDALARKEDFKIAFESDLSSTSRALNAHITLTGTGNADPEAKRYTFQGVAIKTQLHGKAFPAGKLDLELTGNIATDLQQQTLALADVKLQGMGMTAQAELQGTRIFDAPTFTGPLTIEEFNPREVLEKLGKPPLQTADPKVLTQASLSAQMNASPKHLNLDKLAFKLDDSTMSGTVQIKNFSQPAVDFSLVMNQIDLDRYLAPPAENAKGKAASPAGAAAAGVLGLPIDFVRKLNAQGSLRIGTMKAKNIRSADVLITLGARAGLVKLQPLSARLYEGRYKGNVGLDVRGATPKFSMDESLSGVQAGPLLKDLYARDTLSGRATVTAKLSGRGTTNDEIVRTLNGQTAFSFTDGAIKGFNIAKLIRDASARLQGAAPAPGTEPNQTDFSELSGTAVITNGLMRNNDLAAKSPLLRVAGKGDVNLVSRRVDYLVNVSIVNSLEGQQGKLLADLKGLTVPVHISGPFSNLSYRPDVGAVLTDKAREQVQKKLEGKLKDKLPGGVLDKLFGKPAADASDASADAPANADTPPDPPQKNLKDAFGDLFK